MSSNSISHGELGMIDFDLIPKKGEQLDRLIANLKLRELENEEQYQFTFTSIKRAIILKPVQFQQPRIIDHEQVERQVQASYLNPFSHKQKVFIVTVEIKINEDGSPELFEYTPNGYQVGGVTSVYQPNFNSITIDIEAPTLDNPNAIIEEANKKMELTYQFIRSNNATAERFNSTIEQTIESKLKAQKEKLQKLYSGN
jgi:hypothetical protein